HFPMNGTPRKAAVTQPKDHAMMWRKSAMSGATSRPSGAVRLVLLAAAIGVASAVSVWAEEGDSAALAAAMNSATATLQGGLRASETQGIPISAKFEIEDGKLQLSIYTMKGSDFMEVVADPKTGVIAKSEKITDADDL